MNWQPIITSLILLCVITFGIISTFESFSKSERTARIRDRHANGLIRRRRLSWWNADIDGHGRNRSAFNNLDIEHAWMDSGPSPGHHAGPYWKAWNHRDGTIHRIYEFKNIFGRTPRQGRGKPSRRNDPMRIRGGGDPRPTFYSNAIIQVGGILLIAVILGGLVFALDLLDPIIEWIHNGL
jgi:hypothetical protein